MPPLHHATSCSGDFELDGSIIDSLLLAATINYWQSVPTSLCNLLCLLVRSLWLLVPWVQVEYIWCLCLCGRGGVEERDVADVSADVGDLSYQH